MIESPAVAVGAGLRVHHAATAEELVATLQRCWAEPRADVFAFDLAVVPGAGFQRWLSQRLATTGPAGGVRAGVEFSTWPRLLHRLGDDDDPWQPDRLTWVLQRIATTSDDPALRPLVAHLDAAREAWSACSRIARAFARYADHRPAMLAAWARGEDIDPLGAPLGEHAWQAQLWRLAAAEFGETPGQRRSRLLELLRAAPAPTVPARVAVLALRLGPASLQVLDALGAHHRVDLLALTPTPSRSRPEAGPLPVRADFRRPIGHPLNDALAAVADEASLLLPPPPPGTGQPATGSVSLLARLQAGLRTDTPPVAGEPAPGDDSVQLHLSHGPDRQVEVLREVLASLFAADPGLEPRQVAVVTPAVDTVASLVNAAFTSGVGGHPAQRFRLQVADRSVAQTNPLVGLLLNLLQLPDSRLEAATLLDLCGQESVARRFGFTPEARERLIDLVEESGISWGLSARHRAGFALDGFPQNTWFAGIQRMLLGVALSEQDLVTAGTTLPLDDVDSSDVELIGGLTELIGRVQRMMAAFETEATADVWAARCRQAVEAVSSLPPPLQWQQADLWSGLARFSERGGDTTLLNRQAVQRALTDQFRATPARGAFGNGSLVVCGPASLRHVPHRVIVMLGFDADCFPRANRRGGDDLLGLRPLVGDPAPALDDRQLLLDTIHAAREKLVLVVRGRSESSNEPVPLAAPIQELLDALDGLAPGTPASITRHHPLQPFDPRYFDSSVSGLGSVDPIAYAGAVASRKPPAPSPDPHRLGVLSAWSLASGVELDDLVSFFAHPARALLRQRTGLTLSKPRASSGAMPIELDSLQRWQIGSAMLRRIVAGDDPELVRRAEWLRGSVPPFDLGQAVLDGVLNDVRAVQRNLPAWYAHTPTAHDVAIEVDVPGLGAIPLSGRILCDDGNLLQVEFSSLQPRHRLTTWLRLLALTAAHEGTGRAVVIGKSRHATLTAPTPAEASRLLGRYLGLYQLGMSRPLPALPRVCAQWAALRLAERDPADPKVGESLLKRAWQYDEDENWAAFFSYPQALALRASDYPLPGDPGREKSLVGALSHLIWHPLLAAEGEQ